MFDDDVSYSEAIDYVFCGTNSYIESDITENGGVKSGGNCSECGGVLYNYDFEIVCSNCSLVIGSDTDPDHESKWDRFNENRPTYFNSDTPRCVGGFPRAHDWVDSDDIDGPVSELEPETFYE